MKFEVKRDGNSVYCEITVGETSNLVSIRNDIIKYLWNNAPVIPCTVQFKYDNEKYLDNNKSLLELVGSQNCTLLCEINDKIDPHSFITLDIIFENDKIFTSIEVPRNSNFQQIKNIIAESCDIDVSKIFEGETELINGSFSGRELVDSYKLKVSEKLREVNILSILEKGEYYKIHFSNRDKVINLKLKIAEKINYAVDDFVLFYNFDLLQEDNPIKNYKIQSGFSIKYYCFQKVGSLKELEKIVEGTYSTMYKARIVATNELIRIKKYEFYEDLTFPKSFKPMIQELISYTLLDDQTRIVRLKAFYKDTISFYIGMEYMAGGSLHDYVKTHKPLSERLISKWSKQILEGLKVMHEMSIVHRDLKTSIILLDEDNNAKISGFGSSKFFQGVLSNNLHEGFPNSQFGTYNYMAPEVFVENGQVGTKSDIWSFGAILVELVTGVEPFFSMDSIDVALKIKESGTIEYNAPPGMTENLKDFIRKCLVKDPNSRLRAAELLEHEFLK